MPGEGAIAVVEEHSVFLTVATARTIGGNDIQIPIAVQIAKRDGLGPCWRGSELLSAVFKDSGTTRHNASHRANGALSSTSVDVGDRDEQRLICFHLLVASDIDRDVLHFARITGEVERTGFRLIIPVSNGGRTVLRLVIDRKGHVNRHVQRHREHQIHRSAVTLRYRCVRNGQRGRVVVRNRQAGR